MLAWVCETLRGGEGENLGKYLKVRVFTWYEYQLLKGCGYASKTRFQMRETDVRKDLAEKVYQAAQPTTTPQYKKQVHLSGWQQVRALSQTQWPSGQTSPSY